MVEVATWSPKTIREVHWVCTQIPHAFRQQWDGLRNCPLDVMNGEGMRESETGRGRGFRERYVLSFPFLHFSLTGSFSFVLSIHRTQRRPIGFPAKWTTGEREMMGRLWVDSLSA